MVGTRLLGRFGLRLSAVGRDLLGTDNLRPKKRSCPKGAASFDILCVWTIGWRLSIRRLYEAVRCSRQLSRQAPKGRF